MKTRYIISETFAETGKVFTQYVASTEAKAMDFLKSQYRVESLVSSKNGLPKITDCTEYGFFYFEKKFSDNTTFRMKWAVESIIMI